jgi:hypothetical protein
MSDETSNTTGDYSLLGNFVRSTMLTEVVISPEDTGFIHAADSATEAI